jgi:hypothetical protein
MKNTNSPENHFFDPTKATYIHPPEDQYNYPKSTEIWIGRKYSQIETFTSLMCNWVLNVSQILNIWNDEKISIPINPELVKEKLSFQEILSDIVLYQLITWEDDRILIPTSCAKNWKYVNFHNCEIFHSWTYSIFDIYDFWPRISKDEVLNEIITNIRYLYRNDFMDDLDIFECLFIEPDENNFINIWKKGFFQRMLWKVDEFLERYEWEEWKKFFLRQKARSTDYINIPKWLYDKEDIWYDEDLERYENLIFTLKNIKEVISQENIKEIILEFMCLNFDFVKKDLKWHIKKSIELLLQLVYISIRNSIKNILNIEIK